VSCGWLAVPNTRVELIGNDISRFVASAPAIDSQAGEYGQLTVSPLPQLTGQNTTGFWDSRNPGSPFHNVSDLSIFTIDVYRDDVLEYTGGIDTITPAGNGTTAAVTLRSALQKGMESGCIYVTADDDETPATAIRNILELYKVPIDSGSFGAAETILASFNVYCAVALVRPDLTVMDAVQQLAQMGVCALYAYGGKAYLDAYDGTVGTSIYTFSDSHVTPTTIWSRPQTEPARKAAVAGYSIGTTAGRVSFGTSTDTGLTIEAGPDSPIKLLSLNAGIYTGETWSLFMSQASQRIRFETSPAIARSLPLGATVTLDRTAESWSVEGRVVGITAGTGVSSTVIMESI